MNQQTLSYKSYEFLIAKFVFKTPCNQFWGISYFLEKISGFFKQTPTPLRVHLRDFFSKQSCTIPKNLYCPSCGLLSALQEQ